jgi:hypothetical protein
MVSGISTDYTDRYYDLLILQGFTSPLGSQVQMSLGTGLICVGIQKVVQEFVILFLTGKGSNPWDLERGTDFMPNLEKGLIIDENMLNAAFSFATSDIADYLEDKINNDTPDDEILSTASLIEWDLQPGYIKLKIKITTLAGDSAVFIIPASF